MDISSLLSPSLDALPTPLETQEASESATDTVELSSFALVATSDSAVGQQDVPLNDARPRAPGKRAAQPRARARARARAPTAKTKKKKQQQQLTVAKPKKRRRLSAKQLQIRHENELDESQLYNLTLDINDLKQEVQDYMVHKSIHETRTLVNRQRFNGGILRTTHQFFQVLRAGFRVWEQQEAAFLDVTIDQDVAVGTIARGDAVTGSNQFFEQWRRYSKILLTRSVTHSSINILVSDYESCVVECMGEFVGTLTLEAIKVLFPHILNDVELLGKVVNRRFVCPRRTLIYFDASGRVVQYDANVDFFAGLNRILASSPMDVITLMSDMRISSEGSMIPDLGDDHEAMDTTSEEEYGFAPVYPVGTTTPDRVFASSVSPSNSSCSSRSSVEYILS